MADALYKVTVLDSMKELTTRQKIALSSLDGCTAIDSEVRDGASLLINVENYVVLDIHNEKSENKDYQTYIIMDKDGTKYTTSSSTLFDKFVNIVEMLEDAGENLDDLQIRVYTRESKNYKGKYFFTCELV